MRGKSRKFRTFAMTEVLLQKLKCQRRMRILKMPLSQQPEGKIHVENFTVEPNLEIGDVIFKGLKCYLLDKRIHEVQLSSGSLGERTELGVISKYFRNTVGENQILTSKVLRVELRSKTIEESKVLQFFLPCTTF